MFKGAENYRHRGRLLRNAIPADPGGGVVFFVDPQGAPFVGVGVVIAVDSHGSFLGFFSAGRGAPQVFIVDK